MRGIHNRFDAFVQVGHPLVHVLHEIAHQQSFLLGDNASEPEGEPSVAPTAAAGAIFAVGAG